jgi:hypothetical protein
MKGPVSRPSDDDPIGFRGFPTGAVFAGTTAHACSKPPLPTEAAALLSQQLRSEMTRGPQRDIPPLHSITSSASASNAEGMISLGGFKIDYQLEFGWLFDR